MVPSTGAATCDAYDQADRLTAITSGTGSSCTSPTTVGTYTYNTDGLRMSKTVGSTTTDFAWNLSGSLPTLLQERVSGGAVTGLYLWSRRHAARADCWVQRPPLPHRPARLNAGADGHIRDGEGDLQL